MLEFLTLKPETFGLDISDLSLKIIKLEKKGGVLALASVGEAPIEPGIVDKGKIKNEDALAALIKKALDNVKGKKLGTKYAVVSLPEEESFLQIIQMPIMEEEELKKAVFFEAENYIPFSLEEVYLDSQIIREMRNHSKYLDVLIAALPRRIIDPYVSCLKKAGLTPWAFEIESQAIVRALIKGGRSSFPVLLVDLGACRTSFIVFSGYSLTSTFSVAISSIGIGQAISDYFEIDREQADALKIKYGIGAPIDEKQGGGDKNIEARKVFEALAPSLVVLVEEIKKYLSYYRTHVFQKYPSFGGGGVRKIYLCGGGANLKGLPEFLSSKLKISVEKGNPWANISIRHLEGGPNLSLGESLAYTTAFGLAQRGTDDEKD